MTISKWKHPIKYMRLVTTPTCDKCTNYMAATISSEKDCCICERYLEHTNRLEGTRYKKSAIGNVRGTRWCDFEPVEDGDDD